MVTLELFYELDCSSGMYFSEMTAQRRAMRDRTHRLAESAGAATCKHTAPHTSIAKSTDRVRSSVISILTSALARLLHLVVSFLPVWLCQVTCSCLVSQLLLDPEHLGQPAGSLGKLILVHISCLYSSN